MNHQSDYKGKRFFSRIPGTDEPTRVLLIGNFKGHHESGPAIVGIIAIILFLPLYSGWKAGGFDGAWREFVEVSIMMFPLQLLIIIPLIFWYYNRNSGAYFFRESLVKGSRLTKTWMFSWKSSLYSKVTSVSYDSQRRSIDLISQYSNGTMRFKWLSESEEAQLWPLIQSKIGVDKLDRSASQRLAGIQSEEKHKRSWKQNALIAISFTALIAYALWRLKYLD